MIHWSHLIYSKFPCLPQPPLRSTKINWAPACHRTWVATLRCTLPGTAMVTPMWTMPGLFPRSVSSWLTEMDSVRSVAFAHLSGIYYKWFSPSQVMHIIDEVLVPLTPKPPNTEIDNIDALEFMRNADKIDLGGHNLRTYRSQVSLAKKESLFQAPGGHTFLVPVDAGFKVCCTLSLEWDYSDLILLSYSGFHTQQFGWWQSYRWSRYSKHCRFHCRLSERWTPYFRRLWGSTQGHSQLL